MKIRIVGELTNIDDKKRIAIIRVKQEVDNPLALHFIAEFYEAVLKNMRDYNEDAFDEAMMKFVDEDYDRLVAKVEKELNNES